MELRIDYLIFEVTRRCNMNCTHCMRGDSERVNMPFEVVDHVLRDVDSIYTVTFTGGEPFLNFKLIEEIFFELSNRNIEYNSFYIVTNGKIYKQKYIDTLQHEYNYLQSTYRDFTGVYVYLWMNTTTI